MNVYFTPFDRMGRRHMMNRMARAAVDNCMECDVYFPIDIYGENDGYRLIGLLPGVKAEDLNVTVVNETVSIEGEFKSQAEEKEGALLKEIPVGRFSRVLTLPAPLNSDGVEAKLENGVLNLWIPKAEHAKPRSIKVNQAS